MAESKNQANGADELAKMIEEIASGQSDKLLMTDDGRNLAAVLLGRRGGLKGGRVRAARLSPERRSEIATKAAQERWARARDGDV